MPDEPSESSSDLASDAALLGLEDDGLDPDPEVGESSTPTESPSEEEEETEGESKEAATEEPAKEEPEKVEAESEEPPEPTPEETPEKFSFLDREYDTKEAAEHAMKSYLGQVGSKDKQIEELTGLVKDLTDSQHEFLESQKDKAPPQPEGEKKEAESKPSSFWDAFDFDTFEAEAEKDLRTGMEYMVYKVDEHMKSMKDELRQEMSGNIAPFQAWQEQMSEFNESYAYFEDLSNRVNESKEPLYPELNSNEPEAQAFQTRVAEKWMNTFTPEERKRLGAYGAHIAYVLQRADEGVTTEAPAPPPPPEPESKASEAFDRLNRQTNQGANEGVLTGSSAVKPTGKRTSNDIVNQELSEYGETAVEPILGI